MDPIQVLVIVVALVILAAVGYVIVSRNRTRELKGSFGPEYERTVGKEGDPRKAERELGARQKRVASLEIRTLEPQERSHYASEWKNVQARFVDDPGRATEDGDVLVREVMQKRGYPVGDFEQQAADISVKHPAVVEHYRKAHEIAERNGREPVSTEELRTALVHYRALFADLLDLGVEPNDDAPREGERPSRR